MKKNSWKVRNYPSNSKLPSSTVLHQSLGTVLVSLNTTESTCKAGQNEKKDLVTVVNKLRHCSLRYVLDLESGINIAIASDSGAGTYNPQLSNPKLFPIFGLMTKILVLFAQKSPYNETVPGTVHKSLNLMHSEQKQKLFHKM